MDCSTLIIHVLLGTNSIVVLIPFPGISATLGIFIPSFLYVWALNPLIHKMRSSAPLRHFLEAVNVAAVAVMVVVTVKMGENILVDWKTILICVASFAVYFSFKKINTLWIILGGAVLGGLLSFV